MSNRSGAYRSPCPVSLRRAPMTDKEWEVDVARGLGYEQDDEDGDEPDPPAVTPYDTPCAVCGATSPCAYDGNGLPLIHADEECA